MSRRATLPGAPLAVGIATAWLGLLVVLPLAGLAVMAASAGPAASWAALTSPRATSALAVSLGCSAVAALAAAPAGLLLAWVLERERFPGRRVLDALIDLPFALPTSVAGVALTTLTEPEGWLGSVLPVAYSRAGIVLALSFIGLPFVVRTLQPVLAEADRALEEAARTLGASGLQVWLRVVLPPLLPALLAGVGLAFARGLGEYGSVIFIAGNRPRDTEILPLVIVSRLEQFDYQGAAVLGVLLLVLSALVLGGLGALQGRFARRATPLAA